MIRKLSDILILNKQILALLVFLFAFTIAKADDGKCIKIKNKTAIRYYEKGIEQKRKSPEKAYEYFSMAIKEEPNYYHAYYEKALIKYNEALKAYYDPSKKASIPQMNRIFEDNMLKVIDICPSYKEYSAYYYIGELYYTDRRYKEAKEFLELFLDNAEINSDKYVVAAKYYKNIKTYFEIINNPVEFNPVKLEGVCTPDDEFLPLISPDGELAFYTHRYWKETKGLANKTLIDEFTFSERVRTNDPSKEVFSRGIPMPYPFNQKNQDQGGIAITIDNRELYLTLCKITKVRTSRGIEPYNNCDIYVSYNENGQWSELHNLGPNINGRNTWEGQPSITSDGKVLYFASARPDTIQGQGGIDIYYSVRDDNGNWGRAVNLGPKINTPRNDKSPFIHSDSQTLYFASDGYPGLGGFDIYYSRYENGEWTDPRNIGYPINTEGDDLGFVVSASGKKAYFSSNRFNENGGYDIYSFELYQDARPEEVVIAKGTIKDDKGQEMKDVEMTVKNTNTGEKVTAMVDKINGKYAVALKVKDPSDEYLITVKKDDYAYTSAYIKPKEIVQTQVSVEINMEMKPVEIGEHVKINNIHFETNKAIFDKASMFILNDFIEWLEENPNVKIEIHGHTDNVGDAAANQKLSEERAKSVYNYLILFGIEQDRIVAYKGFGEEKPIDTNSTPEGRANNRRVEFVIVDK
ncbi:MAG: OmpA family protein [Marinilabiliales bacterium]